MTAHAKSYLCLELVISSLAGSLKHRREIREAAWADRAEFDRIASDFAGFAHRP